MDGDKPILAANRNCHKLSHVSWAQISCFINHHVDLLYAYLDVLYA